MIRVPAGLIAACAAVLSGCAPPAHHVPIGTVQTAAHLVPPRPGSPEEAELRRREEAERPPPMPRERIVTVQCGANSVSIPWAGTMAASVRAARPGMDANDRWCIANPHPAPPDPNVFPGYLPRGARAYRTGGGGWWIMR